VFGVVLFYQRSHEFLPALRQLPLGLRGPS
jgi:hypothetical protein